MRMHQALFVMRLAQVSGLTFRFQQTLAESHKQAGSKQRDRGRLRNVGDRIKREACWPRCSACVSITVTYLPMNATRVEINQQVGKEWNPCLPLLRKEENAG